MGRQVEEEFDVVGVEGEVVQGLAEGGGRFPVYLICCMDGSPNTTSLNCSSETHTASVKVCWAGFFLSSTKRPALESVVSGIGQIGAAAERLVVCGPALFNTCRDILLRRA